MKFKFLNFEFSFFSVSIVDFHLNLLKSGVFPSKNALKTSYTSNIVACKSLY